MTDPVAAVEERRSGGPSALLGTFGTNVLVGLFGVATSTLAARTLGVDGRGALAAIQIFPTFVLLLGMLGMPDAVVYWLARDRVRGRAFLVTATFVAIGASTVAALIAVPIVPALLHRYPDNVVRAGLLYLVTCPVLAFFHVWQQSLRGVQSFGRWNFARILYSGAWLIALLGAAAASDADAPKVAAIYVAVILVLPPIVWLLARRQVTGERGARRDLVRPLLRFGLPSVGASLPQLLNLRLDQLMLTSLVSAHDLGLYAGAAGWSFAANPVLQAIALVTFPAVAASAEDDKRERVLRAARVGFALALLVGLAVSVVTPIGLTLLYGQDFSDAVPLALVLIAAACVYGWAYILEEGARGLGAPKLPLQAELAGLAVTVVVLLAGVPQWGIGAAAAASLLGYTTTMVVVLLRLRRLMDVPVVAFLRPHAGDFAGLLRRRSSKPD